MILEDDGAGHLNGSYQSKVGDASGRYALVGLYDAGSAGDSVSVSFCVCWLNDAKNSHAVTGWAGNFAQDRHGDFITTTWLLTEEVDPADEWEATKIGQDVFRRADADPWRPAERARRSTPS